MEEAAVLLAVPSKPDAMGALGPTIGAQEVPSDERHISQPLVVFSVPT
jgi:hypothetical protein